MLSDKVIIDGTSYDIPVESLSRKADILDRYAKRVESGYLKRKILGVYYNYELTFGATTNAMLYNSLWDALTAPIEFHEVTVPASSGDYTFTAYFAEISDEMIAQYNGKNYFGNLKVSFVAKVPARSGS